MDWIAAAAAPSSSTLSTTVLADFGSTNGVLIRLYKNGADANIAGKTQAGFHQATMTAVLSLTQGDEITVINSSGDDVWGAASAHTHFEGSLLTRT